MPTWKLKYINLLTIQLYLSERRRTSVVKAMGAIDEFSNSAFSNSVGIKVNRNKPEGIWLEERLQTLMKQLS